jgi:hypothetical protein
MGISESEDILLLPVSYGSVTSTSTLCYGTNSACHPTWLPISGKYNGYGNVEDIVNKGEILRFRKSINNRLFNQDKFAQRQKEGKHLGSFYALFERETHGDFERLEFLTDAKIMDNVTNRENIHNIQSFESDSEFLLALTDNHICYVNHGVSRIGYIILKQSFFDAMVNNHYTKTKEAISKRVYDFIYTTQDGDENIDGRFRHSPNTNKNNFDSKVLGLFNDDNSFSYEAFHILLLLREFVQTKSNEDSVKEHLKEFVDGIVNLALISHIYADIGKSFYPNTSPLKNMSCLNDYANTLQSELNSMKEKNIATFKSDNGEDEEMPAWEAWQTPYID